ncbi:MAG: hypothetical protein PHI94_02005 [Eubacteriaceae bacterium]|nr:hypothetical protein [Eubacteriaceae bacterium]MDD4508437.1 hypothetical protein [Eubacteriaceae bacterium]
MDCDYYRVLRSEETGAVYTGKFMNQYSWAEDVAGSLNHLMD